MDRGALPGAGSVESKHGVEEFAPSQEHITAIADAVRAIRVTPSGGSFDISETTDGMEHEANA